MSRADEVDAAIFVPLLEDALELASMPCPDETRRKVINAVAITCDHEGREPIIPDKAPWIMGSHGVTKEWLEPQLGWGEPPNTSFMQTNDSVRGFDIRKGVEPL